MLPIQSFNPASTPAGGQIALNATDPGAKILFYNLSKNNIKLDFLNGDQDMLHAWEARWWEMDGDTDTIDWTIDSSLVTVGQPPISLVMGTLYGAHEELPGTYPINLSYQTNVGNVVSTVGGVASSVQDDGRAAGNFTVEATPSPDGVSAAFIKNNGQAQLGSTAEAGQLDVTNPAGNHTTITGDGIGIPSNLHIFFDTRTNQTYIGGFSNTAGNGLAMGGNGTFDATLDVTGLALLTGNLTIPNASALQAKDAGGTARSVLSTTAGNVVQLRALAGVSGQTLQLQDETGTAQLVVNDVTPQLEAKNDLQVDGVLIMTNNKAIQGKSAGGTAARILIVDASNNTVMYSQTTGQSIIFKDQDATPLAQFSKARLILNQLLNFGTAAAAQSLANGNTITLPTVGTKYITNAGAVTGIIMTAGSTANDFFFLVNKGTGSITFAAAGSNVDNGSGIVLSAGRGCGMSWNGTSWTAIGAS